MNLPTKSYSSIALICCGGILAVAATLYLKSREPVTPDAPPAAAVAAPVTPSVTLPAPEAPPTVAATSTNTQPYTKAQITQWVAPIALYPDSLLSQVLMASTYPASVVQAVQWSKDNPNQQGDAAIKAVADQPWDASVKSLVAFPQLTGMMGENPQWVENLGNAFLAQPQDVMDAVQDLRKLAQQTGSLKSTYQQTVTTTSAPAPTSTANAGTTSVSTTKVAASPEPTVIRIESANPEVVYVPNYNPTVVYGSNWPYSSAPPVYLPPPPGQQFADSFVRGFGYSLGVATTYAIFSNIDWDDDDHHHDDDYHGGGRGYQHNGDNININVNNFNRISGENLKGQNIAWQHNSAYRGNVPYPNNNVAQRFHQTNVPGGLSSTRKEPGIVSTRPTNVASGLSSPNRDSQRQAAMSQVQQRTRNDNYAAAPGSRDAQRRAASQQLSQKVQRDNFRGYDAPVSHSQRLASQTRSSQTHAAPSRATAQRVQQSNLNAAQRRTSNESPRLKTEQRSTQQPGNAGRRNSALSGNESRAPNWQAQQSRGLQSRQASGLSSERQSRASQGNRASSVGGERNGGGLSGHRELHRR